jgi:predicted Zn-dependent peptidase
VVVGDVATPVLLAALAGLGVAAPEEAQRTPIAPSPPSQDRPDILRQWIGLAWANSPAFDPRAVVAASLASQSLREGQDGYEAYVRLWEGRSQDVLALVGSAYGADARALRRRLSALPGQLAESISAEQVDDVVRRLHWNLISQARTPWGRANLVGRFIETDGSPDAARRYIDRLLAVTVDDLVAFFGELASARPVTVEAGS